MSTSSQCPRKSCRDRHAAEAKAKANAQQDPCYTHRVTRISNPASIWLAFTWPALMLAVCVFAALQLQSGKENAGELVALIVAVVIYRRIVGSDPYEVLEGEQAILVKKGRDSIKIPYEKVEKVEVSKSKLEVTTSDERLKQFKFIPKNTSWLSTGIQRREALEQFAQGFAQRLKASEASARQR